jgi:DNA processing protein
VRSCDGCLRRGLLLAALAGRLDFARSGVDRLAALLALGDDELVAALGWTGAAPAVDVPAARERAATAGLDVVCMHDEGFPERLRGLPWSPRALYVAGAPLEEMPAAALVGARRATAQGLEIAHGLGRGLGAAGVTVVSGMALGVDAAAHAGALGARGRTVAVLATGADVPYPASKRRLYREILESGGSVVSELPPGTTARRWAFPARNRLIALLSAATVVVEAERKSGSLITAWFAREAGRDVAAVPGTVTSPLAAGPNALLYDGAFVLRDAQDALDLVMGVGWVQERSLDPAEVLESRLRGVYEAIARGEDPVPGQRTSAALAELELLGLIARSPGGRYVVSSGA